MPTGQLPGVTQLEGWYCQIHKTNTLKDTTRSAFCTNINADQLFDMMQLLTKGLQALQLP